MYIKPFFFRLLFFITLNLIFNTKSALSKNKSISYRKLNNGQKIPAIGITVFRAGKLQKIITKAIKRGYRLIDSTPMVNDEIEVGRGIHRNFLAKRVQRTDLFISGKLWNTFHRPKYMFHCIETTLADLDIDYLDLYLVNWPTAFQLTQDHYSIKGEEDTKITLEDTWLGLEELYFTNYTKNLGVANFNLNQIKRIMKCQIKPTVVMTEVNPYMIPWDIINYCRQHDIIIMASNPFYTRKSSLAFGHDLNMLKEPIILKLSKKYGKRPVQIILRFLVDLGTIPIVKAFNKKGMETYMDIFDFKLKKKEIKKITKLNANLRGVRMDHCAHFKEYPFTNDHQLQTVI